MSDFAGKIIGKVVDAIWPKLWEHRWAIVLTVVILGGAGMYVFGVPPTLADSLTTRVDARVDSLGNVVTELGNVVGLVRNSTNVQALALVMASGELTPEERAWLKLKQQRREWVDADSLLAMCNLRSLIREELKSGDGK